MVNQSVEEDRIIIFQHSQETSSNHCPDEKTVSELTKSETQLKLEQQQITSLLDEQQQTRKHLPKSNLNGRGLSVTSRRTFLMTKSISQSSNVMRQG